MQFYINEINKYRLGDYIIRAEFNHEIKLLKDNKTNDVDEIQAELLKYTDLDIP